ncbi:hypothetical protein PROFUN_02677 [Planoprotostelium fungivorum]|uniref:Uncharacterized protein n=1 Tax=Planoprotostelium fungivorum TaxID=1890364 RepID=A0A2P6NVH3_9EUKA|nr:hypothetical protein PROFUN_02677 [Planoprotostelium fungivorum]
MMDHSEHLHLSGDLFSFRGDPLLFSGACVRTSYLGDKLPSESKSAGSEGEQRNPEGGGCPRGSQDFLLVLLAEVNAWRLVPKMRCATSHKLFLVQVLAELAYGVVMVALDISASDACGIPCLLQFIVLRTAMKEMRSQEEMMLAMLEALFIVNASYDESLPCNQGETPQILPISASILYDWVASLGESRRERDRLRAKRTLCLDNACVYTSADILPDLAALANDHSPELSPCKLVFAMIKNWLCTYSPCGKNRTEEAERVIDRVQQRYREITRKNLCSFYNKCNVVRTERKKVIAEAFKAIQHCTVTLAELLGSESDEEGDIGEEEDEEEEEEERETDDIDIWEDSFNPDTGEPRN